MRAFAFTGVLLFAVACSPSSSRPERVAEKLFDAFNRHDWKSMVDLYAEEAKFLDPSFGVEPVSKTRSETIAKYTELQKMFPDIHDEVKAMYPNQNTVVIEFISTGTAPDGTTFRLPIVSILTIENGLIVKDATYYDL